MNTNALFKILFAFFLLYLALPAIGGAQSPMSSLFWVCWLAFFVLVIGANVGNLLNIKTNSSVEKVKKRTNSTIGKTPSSGI
ncbi:hypothetical protein HNQ94_000522 [Salirhabdus euzebyi]|uniref:Uncharacterized protein n=1 Tax=Salirhabdus euzebyi TaxID=394506 RepID=A0A841PYL6_9BACI|nr:hypothetical protein [Salirhabdus euzebyi]MBB6452101.1 hypothetical protein [Salirhabdus euzebyi]